jgi:hypothetical protein
MKGRTAIFYVALGIFYYHNLFSLRTSFKPSGVFFNFFIPGPPATDPGMALAGKLAGPLPGACEGLEPGPARCPRPGPSHVRCFYMEEEIRMDAAERLPQSLLPKPLLRCYFPAFSFMAFKIFSGVIG